MATKKKEAPLPAEERSNIPAGKKDTGGAVANDAALYNPESPNDVDPDAVEGKTKEVKPDSYEQQGVNETSYYVPTPGKEVKMKVINF